MASDDISANTNLINKGDPQMPANCLPSNMQKNNFTPNLDPKFKVLKVLVSAINCATSHIICQLTARLNENE